MKNINCDICDEKIHFSRDKFEMASLVARGLDFKAHFECAKVFNEFRKANRIKYLQSWLKEVSNEAIELTCGDVKDGLE